MSSQYGELRPTYCWDRFTSLGHPCKFQWVSRLGSVTARHSSSGPQPNFAMLNRGRHLYWAGRPSRSGLSHILACLCCVRFSFFSAKPRDWLGRTSPKLSIFDRVRRKTLTESVTSVPLQGGHSSADMNCDISWYSRWTGAISRWKMKVSLRIAAMTDNIFCLAARHDNAFC